MSAERLGPFLEAAPDAGMFIDFDGTLSPIAHLPSEARPLEGVAEVLVALTVRFKLVAIVSGRSARELSEWLGPDVEIWGTHGAEKSLHGRTELSTRAAAFTELMGRVRDEAAARLEELDLEGVLLEDKQIMIGLHYRAASDVKAAKNALEVLARELAECHGLRVAGGRLAFELRPPAEFTKAEVVLARARELDLRAAAFVGDDRVDLPGFDALDILAEDGVATLRVAVDSDESPPQLIERADVVVDGPGGVLRFLRELAGH